MNNSPNKKTRLAAAVTRTDAKPELVAAGVGRMAELIIQAAGELKIRTENNAPLAKALVGENPSQLLNLEQSKIPEEGLALLAEVCAWLFDNEKVAADNAKTGHR